MKLWIVSMECAGIAEAGGVKNVTFSLCKEFSLLNHSVTLFIPVFKCSSWDLIKDKKKLFSSQIQICGQVYTVNYFSAKCIDGNFDIIFIDHPVFSEKEAIYTYTEHEFQLNNEHKKGNGHTDSKLMDIMFQKAVAEYGSKIDKKFIPDIVHCQDASTAVLPAFLNEKEVFSKTKTVVTIHNCGPAYHHDFSSIGEAAWYTGLDTNLLSSSLNGLRCEPFLIAANSRSYLTTVSEDYAKELLDPTNTEQTDGLSKIFAEKNISIKGITNGFDFDRYNPQSKKESLLPFTFNPEKLELEGKYLCRQYFLNNINSVENENLNIPGIKKYGFLEYSQDPKKDIYICYHGRITFQKGITILLDAIPAILDNFDNVKFIIAGQGEQNLENKIIHEAEVLAGRLIFINGYDKALARLCTAVSDFAVLPSFFEPCGLEDFIAQVYGTIPLAHKTGGLNKIIDSESGFLYKKNKCEALIAKLSQVITVKILKPGLINKIIKNGAVKVHKEYLWTNIVKKHYLKFFTEIIKKN